MPPASSERKVNAFAAAILMPKRMKISNVKNRLSRAVNQVYRKKTRVLIEKSGIPDAAILSVDDP